MSKSCTTLCNTTTSAKHLHPNHWSNVRIDTDCNQLLIPLLNGLNNGFNHENTLEETKSSIPKWKRNGKVSQLHRSYLCPPPPDVGRTSRGWKGKFL